MQTLEFWFLPGMSFSMESYIHVFLWRFALHLPA